MPLAADDFADRRSFRGGEADAVGRLFGIARHRRRRASWWSAVRTAAAHRAARGQPRLPVVLDPEVDPASLRVEVRYEDGRVLRAGPGHGNVR